MHMAGAGWQERDAFNTEVLSQSIMNQSLYSLNNSSFVQIEAGVCSALPTTLFGGGGGGDANPQR